MSDIMRSRKRERERDRDRDRDPLGETSFFGFASDGRAAHPR